MHHNCKPGKSQSKFYCMMAGALVIALLLLASGCPAFSKPEPPPPVLPPQAQNQPPIVKSVTAITDGKPVLSSTECQIVCDASDADGDALSYKWTATGGVIRGDGGRINWTAPDTAGAYTVTVVVADAKGGESTGSVSIPVIARPNNLPVIREVMVGTEKKPVTAVVENDRKIYKVQRYTTTTIKCIAEDPDGDKLSYIWSASDGKISGQGDEVGWTAPGASGEYTVTVKVSDNKGGTAQTSLIIDVLCCGR